MLQQAWGKVQVDQKAGKTTLVSTIIERLLSERSTRGSLRSVAYFYFKHREPDKRTYNALLRALLEQLIDYDATTSNHFFDEVASMAGVNLRSTQTLAKLLKTALEGYQTSYLVIDGLDECDRVDTTKPVQWVLSLINKGLVDQGSKLRVLFSGQRDGVFDVLLTSQSSISLETPEHKEDIRTYCAEFCQRIQAKFEISSVAEEILSLVVTEADGRCTEILIRYHMKIYLQSELG
jgi:NACHT domain